MCACSSSLERLELDSKYYVFANYYVIIISSFEKKELLARRKLLIQSDVPVTLRLEASTRILLYIFSYYLFKFILLLVLIKYWPKRTRIQYETSALVLSVSNYIDWQNIYHLRIKTAPLTETENFIYLYYWLRLQKIFLNAITSIFNLISQRFHNIAQVV